MWVLSLALLLLLLHIVVVNTKVGSDFNLSKNANHAIVKRQNVDKESTDEVQFLCLIKHVKNTSYMFLFHQIMPITQLWF